MAEEKVMIGCPVRNRAWILPRYLEALDNMDYPHHHREYCFIVNNSTDGTEAILRGFALNSPAQVKITVVNFEDAGGTRRGEYRLKNLAYLRNLLLNEFMLSDCTYLFSVDSDILVPPPALSSLISHKTDIVSALVPNGHLLGDENIYNILSRDQKGNYIHIKDFPRDKIFAVDITGAAYLINKRVIKEGGVRYSAAGGAEDIGFCERAKSLGFKIYCDPRIKCEHVMTP